MNKKVVVTGGAGYIGSHTAVELQNSGYDVIIIDNLSNSDISVLDGIEKITGRRPAFYCFDLCNRVDLDKFIVETGEFDAVIHFAAHKAVGESVSKPLKYYYNNLVSLTNILDAMKQNGVSSFVFSSSQ